MISLEGINGSFYLPPESLTFLRCLEFFKNKMLRHSAQLNIPNGLNCMTKFVTSILVFTAESPKSMIANAKLHFKAYESTYMYTLCAKGNKRGNRNTNLTFY